MYIMPSFAVLAYPDFFSFIMLLMLLPNLRFTRCRILLWWNCCWCILSFIFDEFITVRICWISNRKRFFFYICISFERLFMLNTLDIFFYNNNYGFHINSTVKNFNHTITYSCCKRYFINKKINTLGL